VFFFFKTTTTTEIYIFSLHDALPICATHHQRHVRSRAAFRRPSPILQSRPNGPRGLRRGRRDRAASDPERRGGLLLREPDDVARSEEHTSELQSRRDLVCRLLLEKKK